MSKVKEPYREVDLVALRSELSRHPQFFDRDDLVDSVVSLVADFPPITGQGQDLNDTTRPLRPVTEEVMLYPCGTIGAGKVAEADPRP